MVIAGRLTRAATPVCRRSRERAPGMSSNPDPLGVIRKGAIFTFPPIIQGSRGIQEFGKCVRRSHRLQRRERAFRHNRKAIACGPLPDRNQRMLKQRHERAKFAAPVKLLRGSIDVTRDLVMRFHAWSAALSVGKKTSCPIAPLRRVYKMIYDLAYDHCPEVGFWRAFQYSIAPGQYFLGGETIAKPRKGGLRPFSVDRMKLRAGPPTNIGTFIREKLRARLPCRSSRSKFRADSVQRTYASVVVNAAKRHLEMLRSKNAANSVGLINEMPDQFVGTQVRIIRWNHLSTPHSRRISNPSSRCWPKFNLLMTSLHFDRRYGVPRSRRCHQ